MPKPAAGRDIPELTALRVVAALCVVVAHLHGLGIVSATSLHHLLDGGRPAVSFFFVLSGFIMVHNYPQLDAHDGAATRRYAFSRFARLYPTLLLSLCLALPTGLHLLATHASAEMLALYAIKNHDGLWLGLSGLAQLLGVTGWFPVAAINQPWNGAAWSLSCEFFFYAMFPFVRPALQRQTSRFILLGLLAAWLLQGAWIGALHAFVPPNRSAFLVYQLPLTHFFEFTAGICAGILITRFNRRQLDAFMLVATLAALAMIALIQVCDVFMPAFYALTPLFVAVIIATARSSGAPWLASLRQGGMIALGHASYALYIAHVPILDFAAMLGVAQGLGWWWVPLLLLASLLIHYGFAEPVRRRLLFASAR